VSEEHPEQASAYFVQDRGNLEEMKRQDIQDHMLTTGMGGVLPELTDPSVLRSVLDVGCGTGGWLIETARAYPTIERLIGADVSSKVVAYARARAEHLKGRVEFQTMDALRMLEFPPSSFDLVNQRLGASWLGVWDWTKLLIEYLRVCRPSGIIRITDANIPESNSQALTQLQTILLTTFYRSGRFFEKKNDGLTCEFVRLLKQHGIEDVQSQVHTLVFRAGTERGQFFSDDMALGFRVLVPFFQRWTRLPQDYEQIYQQACREMQEPDFVATWTFLTVWGTTPKSGSHLLMRGLL
jgi:ubiquinone/menaquinone biosynthesis C-methylase UbiE